MITSFYPWRNFIFVFVFSFTAVAMLFAQPHSVYLESGSRTMEYYAPQEYGGNGQNWTVVQDSNGFMYFGNTDGFILQFDGVHWRKIKIDNESIVRSLFITEDGIILVGAQDEFGYLKTDRLGRLVYQSLVGRVGSENIQFSDVWKITVNEDKAYFISRNYLFSIPIREIENNESQIDFIYSEDRLHTFYTDETNILYILKMEQGLFGLSGDSLKKIPGGDFYKNSLFSGVLPHSKSIKLIATRTNGLFLYDGFKSREFKTEADLWMKENQLYSTLQLKDGNFLMISRKGGALIINGNGGVLYKYDKSNGLKSNTIWAAYQDKAGSIWFCLNKGIVRLDYTSPFSFFGEEVGLDGSVHDVKRFNGRLYVSTGTGLFYLDKKANALKANYFKRFDEINTQCWYLTATNDFLFACTNNGIYEISADNKIRIINKYNAWTIVQSTSNPSRFFVGLDVGISSIIRQSDGTWMDEIVEPMANIEGRTIVEDSLQNIWIGSSYQGIARITNFSHYLDSGKNIDVEYFNIEHGLPSNRLNLVKQTQSGIRFNTTAGIMIFDETSKLFSADPGFPMFNKLKQSEDSHVLSSETENGNLWCNLGAKIVVINHSDKTQFIDKPFLNLPELNIQTIFVEEDNVCWFGGADGLIRFNGRLNQETEVPLKTFLRSVFINNDSLVFAGNHFSGYITPTLDPDMNNLRFEFALPEYDLAEEPLYQYYLNGFDEEWSVFKDETAKEYTNLGAGKYSFMVRTQTVFGITKETQFKFEIQSPWFLSLWFILFLLVFVGLIVLVAVQFLVKTTRSRAVLEQQKLTEERNAIEQNLRNQMAADFHDELGNKITRISLFSELIKQEKSDLPENVIKYISKISENTNALYTETRDFIWQLDPKKDTLIDFITRIKKFADELFDEASIHFELNNTISNAESIKLSMEWRRHLVRIFKEALHNSFKYAQCKNIIFKLSIEDEQLKIELSDDGLGFDVTAKSEGNGLRNMLNRSQKIGANLSIESKVDKGTKIKMAVNKPAEL